MKTCESCKHCGVITVPAPAAAEDETVAMQAVHLCRINPPSAALMPTPSGMQSVTLWPQIAPAMDYCGSYVEAPAAEADAV